MGETFAWDTAGGIGLLLAGLGVFFWGLRYQSFGKWKGWKDKEDKD
jgi:hypothetical protein